MDGEQGITRVSADPWSQLAQADTPQNAMALEDVHANASPRGTLHDEDQHSLKCACPGSVVGSDGHSQGSKQLRSSGSHAESKRARGKLASGMQSRMVVIPDSESETEPEEYGA